MARLCNVKEILWISAPELILAAIVCNTLSTSSIFVPLAREYLLNRSWQLHKVNLFGSEESEEERSFIFLTIFCLNVGHNNVVHGLVVIGWAQCECACDFSLFESLNSFCSF